MEGLSRTDRGRCRYLVKVTQKSITGPAKSNSVDGSLSLRLLTRTFSKPSQGKPDINRTGVQEAHEETRTKTKLQGILAPHYEAGIWVSPGSIRDQENDIGMTHGGSGQHIWHVHKETSTSM